jgi:predicted SprT family Zn-dependent metalloprotease
MNVQVAHHLAIQLMRKHGLIDKGWRFEFDNAKRRFGVCRFRSKRIGLSKPLTLVNDVEQVQDTILHEIAHAIAGYAAGHGPEWKEVCVQIGAKPERCYTEEDTTTIAGKYRAVCGGCGKTYHRHKKVPAGRRQACPCQSHVRDWNMKKLLEFKVATA